jgi:hypothetical protein
MKHRCSGKRQDVSVEAALNQLSAPHPDPLPLPHPNPPPQAGEGRVGANGARGNHSASPPVSGEREGPASAGG